MLATAVLHHDEPALQGVSMANSACGHWRCCCLKHLFHEYRAIGEPSVLSISGNGAGRCVHDVQLLRTLTLVSCYRPASQELIGCAIGGGDIQISVSVG